MMPLINITKNKIISEEFEECSTFWEQTKGMMFRKKVVPLVFSFKKEQVVRLHSFFCPGAIDLVLLNEDWLVVELCSEWPVKSSFVSENKCMFLLELPVGSIAESNTELGDVIHIKRS